MSLTPIIEAIEQIALTTKSRAEAESIRNALQNAVLAIEEKLYKADADPEPGESNP